MIQINTTIKKSSLWDGIYILLVCLNVFAKILVSSNLSTFLGFTPGGFEYRILRITIYGLLLLFFAENKHSRRKIIILLAMAVCVVATYVNANTLSFTLMFLLVASYPENLTVNRIAKHMFCVTAVGVIMILCLFKTGYVDNNVMYRLDGIARNSLGFSSPNAFANMVCYGLLMFMCWKGKKWTSSDFVIWLGILALVYKATDGRMSCLVGFILILIEEIWRLKAVFSKNDFGKQKNNRVLYIVEGFLFEVGLALSLSLTLLYKNGLYMVYLAALDKLMSFRLSFMVKYFNDPGITIWGNMIRTVTASSAAATGEKWSGLDNSYMYMLIVWGIIATGIFAILLIQLSRYHKERQNKYDAICVIGILVIAFSEASLFNVTSNIAIFMIAEMVSSKQVSAMEEKVNYENEIHTLGY